DGTGTVASSIGDISYSYPTSTSETTTPLALGTTITLTATAGDDTKVFWEDCTAIGGVVSGNGTTIATCTFSALESSKIVNVTFQTGGPVAIGAILYSSLQLACDAAVDQDKILISEGVISGPVIVDSSNITMFLEGGWSCDFSPRTGGISVVQGPFTIKNGSISVDEITIK
ncbi:hypothetical protein KAI46_09960, partial [bacterium]|nr:hypothetical protein [bacterium]